MEWWRVVEDLVNEGHVKHVGLVNANIQALETIITHSQVKPTVLQVEMHPEDNLLEFCKAKGIVVAASTESISILSKCEDNHVLIELSSKYGKTPEQVVLRWALQIERAITPLHVNGASFKDHLEVLNFNMTWSEVSLLNNLAKKVHLANEASKFIQPFPSTLH